MVTPLVTYLHDHLAGARFAVNLLQDLQSQSVDADAAELAAHLLPEIEEDRGVVEMLASELEDDRSTLKEAVAWLTQKAGRLKLSMSQPDGVFEAVEVLALGVLGKLALWNTLRVLSPSYSAVARLDLQTLCERAESQHAALEHLRRQLARTALSDS